MRIVQGALVAVLALGIGGAQAQEKKASEKLKVGFVYVGPVADYGYSFQHDQSRKALAAALGFSPALLHYAFMTLVSITAVGAFDAVGSVLVVALMIAPPAAAYLLTDSLPRMLVLSVALAVVAAASVAVTGWASSAPTSRHSSGTSALSPSSRSLSTRRTLPSLLAPRRTSTSSAPTTP